MTPRLLILIAACAPMAFSQALTITTPNALPVATINQAYSVQLTATGGSLPYFWRVQVGGNPSVRFTVSGSGLLSGTPTSADLGVVTFAMQVTDAGGVTVTKQLSVTVLATQPLAMTTTAFTPGVVGIPYSLTLAATGGTPPYKWDVLPAIVTFPVPGQVAPGLTLDSATGQVTGTPTSAASFSFTITLTDKANGSVSKPFTLTVSAGVPLGITTGSLPDGIVGAQYSQTLGANGGIPPYSWAVTTGSLPNGLVLDAKTGVISGAPLAAATSAFTVTLTDSAAKAGTARQALSVRVVAPPALTVTTSLLPGATEKAPYSQVLGASGGVPPYTWSITAGALPAGLRLNPATGGLEGTPSTAGTSTFTVQVADSAAGTQAKATKAFTINVARLTQISLSSGTLAGGTVNRPYAQSLAATGGALPYTWSAIAGTLPPGLLLSSSGVLAGVPTTAATFGFTAQVTDAAGGATIGTVSVPVAVASLTLAPLTLPSGIVGAAYPVQVLSAAGGTPPYAFSIQENLPAGLSLTNGVIGGTPTSAGTSSFTLRVTDAAQNPATSPAQLVVRSQAVDLVLSAVSFGFAIAEGATDVPEPQLLAITSSGVATPVGYQLSVSPAAPWLSVTGFSATGALNGSASSPGGINVSLTSAALSLAVTGSPYTTAITVACLAPSPCAGTSQKVNVSLAVTAPPPQLTLTTASLALTSSAPTGIFGLQNTGGGSITVQAVTAADGWLVVEGAPTRLSPGPPSYVKVTANPTGLAAGRLYRGSIRVATSAGTTSLPVTLLVASGISMTLNPTGQQFQMAAGGAVGNPAGVIQVLVDGGANVNWTAATLPGSSWLTVRTTTGTSTSTTPGTLNYAVEPTAAAALQAGTYYGRIRVTSGQATNTPVDFLVVLNVATGGTAPDPDLQPSGLVFVATGGVSTPVQTVQVFASSTTPVPYQASALTASGAQWLSVTPTVGAASANAPGRATVTVNPAGLAPGVYRGVVTYQYSSAALRSVNVTYIVPTSGGALPFFHAGDAALLPRAGCTATKVVVTANGLPTNFAQPASWPVPVSVQLSDDCGTTIGNGTVDVTFSNGDPPIRLTTDSGSGGRYSGTWTPRSTASQVTVTAFAVASGLAAAKTQIVGKVTPNIAPALTPGGMLNVFNPSVGAGIAPGTAVQIYGTNLAGPGVSALATSLPFPTSLSGTAVLIGGTFAPLYFVSPGQINALAPFELQPGVPYQVLVTVNGALTTPDLFTSTEGAPGIAAFANGGLIAQHVDATFSLVTEASPAKPGEIIVLYLAGLGSTVNQPATGSGAPLPPTAPLASVTMTIGGKATPLEFVGLTPGSVGLYQIAVKVPEDAADGNQPLVVTQAGAVSNVTILPVRK